MRQSILARLLTPLAVVSLLVLSPGLAWATPAHFLSADPVTPNPNCSIIVPPNPTSAGGLQTPYELFAPDARKNGQCHEASPAQSAFVEATILDPATGNLSIYRPLVIDRGTRPGVLPVPVTLPPNAVVGVWFGFQGTTLTLINGRGCVNGVFGSPFGQFAYCGAPEFFRAAHTAIQAGLLTLPPLGQAKDGQPCPTTRDFSVVDQDQSDNVITRYVVLGNGLIAQDNGAVGDTAGSTFLNNGSDNGLLDNFIVPALGCQLFTAPDLTAGGRLSSSLALNELFAEEQPAPVALVPPNDPMALINGKKSFAKTDLYRLGVDQLPLGATPPSDVAGSSESKSYKPHESPYHGFGFAPFAAFDTSRQYCLDLINFGQARLFLDRQFTTGQPSPDVAQAPELFGFLMQRFAASLTNLGCPAGVPPAGGN
jgi:hypothetical protein